jgi:hypothetical protein
MLEEFQEELERCVVFYKVRPSERLWNRFKTLCKDCETLKSDFIKTALFGNKKVPLLYFVLVTHQLIALAKIVIELQPESVYYVSEGTHFRTVLSHVYLREGEEWVKMINLLRRLDTFTKLKATELSSTKLKATELISTELKSTDSISTKLKTTELKSTDSISTKLKETELISAKSILPSHKSIKIKTKTKRSKSLSFAPKKKSKEKARAKSLAKKESLKQLPLFSLSHPIQNQSSSNPNIECDWPFCGQSLPFDEFQAHSRCHIMNSVNSRGLNEVTKNEVKSKKLDPSSSEEEMIRLAMEESLKLPS